MHPTSLVRSVIRGLNARRRRWSAERDRAFHDAAFAGRHYDPFDPAYPGYLTIRRFADLALERLRPGDLALDLGCGPGEVTCELARRLPSCQFVGVDHSREAVSRAEGLAAAHGLGNVRFELGDVETRPADSGATIVMMFDAFHHLADPGGFVRRMGGSVNRFFLIEPAGNALGRWQRTLDLDWLSEALFAMRNRLEYQFGLPVEQGPADTPGGQAAGEATEHRYALDDFSRWFAGFGVDVRGTIAGLERYDNLPHARNPLRADVGEVSYRLLVELEAVLRRRDLDLAAKHWAVYAERGRTFPARRPPVLERRDVERPLAGPYDAVYDDFRGPASGAAGTEFTASVHVVNRSWRCWDSSAGDGPVLLSYHWLDRHGVTVVQDGLRNPLPRPVSPGEGCTASLRVRCPDRPGTYILAVELVHEQVTWFSLAGSPPLTVRMKVR